MPRKSESDCLATIEEFVRRARRVYLHSLARDLPRLEELAAIWEVTPTWPTPDVIRIVVPDEEALESLAVRCRPVTLQKDMCSWRRLVEALDTLAQRVGDLDARQQVKRLRAAWMAFADTGPNARWNHAVGGPTTTGPSGIPVTMLKNDIELAAGWSQVDAHHVDKFAVGEMRGFTLDQRYLAAINRVCAQALLVVQTLYAVGTLAERPFLSGLNVVCFTERIIVDQELHDRLPSTPPAPSSHSHPGDGALGSDWVLGRPVYRDGVYVGPEEPLKGAPFSVA